jgi:hypothetical protein
MNYHERTTQLEETANTEAMTVFAEIMNQFKARCKGIHNVEANLTTLGHTAFNAALESSGRVVETYGGVKWQHGADLMENVSICHRRMGAGFQFAVVEFVPMKSGETKNLFMGSDGSVRELLKTFVRDERQLLSIWKNDIVEEVKEHLAEKYPNQDMSIVAGSFEIKLARAISERPTLAQNHSRGMRI